MKLFKSAGTLQIVPTFISLIIVLLSFIYLPKELVETIALQYGAMGAAILTMVPFIILFYFSFWVSENLLISKVTWIFYVVYYFGIFIYKMATFKSYATWSEFVAGNIFYLGAIIAGVVMFFLVKKMRIWKIQQEVDSMEEEGETRNEKLVLLNKLREQELNAVTGSKT